MGSPESESEDRHVDAMTSPSLDPRLRPVLGAERGRESQLVQPAVACPYRQSLERTESSVGITPLSVLIELLKEAQECGVCSLRVVAGLG